MADGTIDKLSIEISTTAAVAVKDIKNLTNALAVLDKNIGSSATKLKEVARSLTALKTAAATLNISNLKSLSELKLSNSLSKNVKALSTALSQMPTDIHSKLSPLASLKALDNVKLSSSIGNGLARIATALNTMPLDTASRLAGLPTLRHLSGIKISTTIANNLTKLAHAVRDFPADVASRLTGLAQALVPLKSLNGMRITGAINGLRQLPDVLKSYQTLNIHNLVAQLDQLNPRLKSLAVSANSLKLAFNKMPASLRTTAAATRTVVSANRQLDMSYNSAAKSSMNFVGKLTAVVVSFSTLRSIFNSTIGEVNTYIENMNLFEASMGKYTKSASEFGNKVQELMGIDFGQWARNQGVFQTLITGMGDTAERASVMSQQLTQLGYDISSFYNISVDDAMLKLQSGMSGELEPLRRLGWDLSNARMQLEATKLGIEQNVTTMTQAEKVGLRYYMIMNQVTQTHGDMARTIASPANQLRVFQAQITLAARAIGNLFIPALNAILPYAIAVAKAIRIVAETIAKFFGIDAKFEVDYSNLDTSGIASGNDEIEDTANALDDAGKAADKAAKKIKEYKNSVMGFDELHKLNDSTESTDTDSGKSGAAAVPKAGGVGLPLDTYDFLDGLNDYISKLSDSIAQKMVAALKKIFNALKAIAPVVAGIGAGFAAWKIARGLSDGLANLSRKLNYASKGASQLGDNFSQKGNTRAANIASGLATGLSILAAKAADIGKAIGGWKLAGVVAAIGVIVARTVDLWMHSEKFRKGIESILGWIKQIPPYGEIIADAFKIIGQIVSNIWEGLKGWAKSIGIDISFLDPVFDAFKSLIDLIGGVFGGVIEALNLDFVDLGITVAGIVLIVSGIGAPLGVALLVFEAISLAIRAIGWASSDCVTHMDALANVSEETSKKFGSSIDSMESAIKEIDEINFSNAVVQQSDVESVSEKCADIRNTILNNLDAKRNEELAQIDAMAGFMTAEEIENAKKRVNESYDKQKEAVTQGTAEITKILTDAKDAGVALSQEQSDRITEILDQQFQQLIETSGASSEEIEKISKAMHNNETQAALKAAESVISEAKRVRDERKATAEEDYQNQLQIAEKLYRAGDIDKKRYEEIVAAATDAKDTILAKADEQYEGIVEKTQNGLGDASNKFNFATGKMKSNWEQFCDDIAQQTRESDEIIAAGWSKIWDDLNNAFESFTSSIAGAWQELCSDIENWYRDNLEPLIDSIKDLFQNVSESISNFLTDPVGAIKSAWEDLCDWFRRTIVEPIQNLFSNFELNIPIPQVPTPHLDWENVTTPVGEIAIPKIDFYAKGGFPTSGQLFMARENGLTEMVGQMGGKSAVANNQQIVEGIEQGVMSAMLQVLPAFQSDKQSGDVTMILQVGNEQLAKAVNRGNASMARRGQIRPEIQYV